MMRTILGGFALLVLLMPAPAGAQRNEVRARVIQEAPLVLLPDARRVPLRVAAVGTTLVVIGDEGEWLNIQFQDPQYGLRTGYVQRRFVEILPRQVAIGEVGGEVLLGLGQHDDRGLQARVSSLKITLPRSHPSC